MKNFLLFFCCFFWRKVTNFFFVDNKEIIGDKKRLTDLLLGWTLLTLSMSCLDGFLTFQLFQDMFSLIVRIFFTPRNHFPPLPQNILINKKKFFFLFLLLLLLRRTPSLPLPLPFMIFGIYRSDLSCTWQY